MFQNNCRYLVVVLMYAVISSEGSEGHHHQTHNPVLQQVTAPFELSEGPTWDQKTQLLYFVDIHRGLVNSYNPYTKQTNTVHLDGEVTPVVPTKQQGRFVVGLNKTVVLMEWDGTNSSAKSVVKLTEVSAGYRFNDGKADRFGRLWWGTIGYENSSGVVPNQASFYKITKDNVTHPQVMIPNVTNSNGLAWSMDNTKLYYIDTPTRKIAQFDFDLFAGKISNRKVAFDLAVNNITGYPDGMTIDTDDNLYIALFNGGSVIKVNPRTGKLLQQIALPAQHVTSAMWGNRHLDTLYVTTSRYGLSDLEHSQQPSAGSVFAIRNLGARGRPTYYADF